MLLGLRHGTVTIVPSVAVVLCLGVVAAARGQDAAAAKAASGTTAVQPGGPLPYWQAPALPTAVIQGGTIPQGWQPQAVPYQGIGPDGRPMTVYFAPTYVFTYQSGPPVLAAPPVSGRAPAVAPAASPYGAYGWNYQTQGAPSVPVTLPPATVTRYQPAPYQFPPDARALTGTPIAPPATPLPVSPPVAPPVPPQMTPQMTPQQPGFVPTVPQQQLATPPAQWVPAAATP